MAYSTKQQQAVLACLVNRRQELISVSELAAELRQSGNPVGLATIYRQLERLEQAGHIHKVNTEEGALYQYCNRDETDRDCFLLKCQGCGRLLHLDCSHLRPLYEHLEREHHILINSRETMFSGLCDVCAAKQREEPHQ